MNTTVSVSGRNTTESKNLKNLQLDFLRWAANWTTQGKEAEEVPHDYTDIVILLQALGYQIRKIDTCDPQEVTPLSGGDKGNRIIVSCCHSGQRCFLEYAQPQDSCRCSKDNEENKDSFWEVTATTNTSKSSFVIESGSDLIPMIPKELSAFMRGILSYSINLCHEKGTSRRESLCSNASDSRIPNSKTSSPKENAKRLSAYMRELVDNEKTPKAVEEQDPSHRYGSLDTLLLNELESAKTPTDASTQPKKVNSSPSIVVGKESVDDKTSTERGTEIERASCFLRNAVSSLHTALEILGQKSSISSLYMLNDNASPNQRSDTSPRLAPEAPKKISKLPRTPTVKVNALAVPKKPPSGSIGLSKNDIKPNVLSTKPPTGKKSNLYAHVKSTIPKGNAIRKKNGE